VAWQAKPGCAEHHRAAVERIVNALPPSWLLHPQSGEIFDDLDYCNRRMRGYSLAEGFDVVRKGGGSKDNPSWRFFCLYHGEKTKNTRKLEDRVEMNEAGIITSKRQRDNTSLKPIICAYSRFGLQSDKASFWAPGVIPATGSQRAVCLWEPSLQLVKIPYLFE
jgi:hypothetical protein